MSALYDLSEWQKPIVFLQKANFFWHFIHLFIHLFIARFYFVNQFIVEIRKYITDVSKNIHYFCL